MPPQMRPRCQVLNCRERAASKGRDADGQMMFRTRCTKHHRCKTPAMFGTLPAGIRQVRGICGPFSQAGDQVEAIAPVLTTDPDGPDQKPGDSTSLTLPVLGQQLLTQLTLEDAEAEGIVLALRLRGLSQRRIADVLGKNHQDIHRILRNARADNKINDVLVDLTHHSLPLAVERLLEHLDEGEPWAIKETLRGLGAFRTYRQQDTHRDSEETRTLHIKFETPDHPVILNAENIVGVPRRLTKGVVDASVSQVRVESPGPETLRAGRPGRDRDERSGGQSPSHEGPSDSGTSDDPLAACLQGT